MKSLSRVRLFATPWTVACQVPPSMGFFQARILEWVAISFSRSSQPRGWTWVSRIVGRRFTVWATREVQDANTIQWRKKSLFNKWGRNNWILIHQKPRVQSKLWTIHKNKNGSQWATKKVKPKTKTSWGKKKNLWTLDLDKDFFFFFFLNFILFLNFT